MFLRDTCRCENCQRNSRDKRFAREACFDQGGCQVEKDIVTFNEEEDEHILVEEGPQFKAAQCFSGTHATREIYQRNICDKRLPREA